jgi:hypothetical protein
MDGPPTQSVVAEGYIEFFAAAASHSKNAVTSFGLSRVSTPW